MVGRRFAHFSLIFLTCVYRDVVLYHALWFVSNNAMTPRRTAHWSWMLSNFPDQCPRYLGGLCKLVSHLHTKAVSFFLHQTDLMLLLLGYATISCSLPHHQITRFRVQRVVYSVLSARIVFHIHQITERPQYDRTDPVRIHKRSHRMSGAAFLPMSMILLIAELMSYRWPSWR